MCLTDTTVKRKVITSLNEALLRGLKGAPKGAYIMHGKFHSWVNFLRREESHIDCHSQKPHNLFLFHLLSVAPAEAEQAVVARFRAVQAHGLASLQ